LSEPWKGELFSGFVDVTLSLRWWAAGGSTREIQKGDLVLAEITGTYYGYPGQLIRPIALGDPPPELRG
jgi:hypothetical protein